MTPGLKFRWHKEFLASDLGKTAKLVGVRVWDYAGADGCGAHPGRELLAEDLVISKSTVDRSLKECRDAGWLLRTSGSNNHPSREWADVYALVFPDRSSSVTSDVDPDRSSPMTTDPADRSSNEGRPVVISGRSVVMGDDPIDPFTPEPSTTDLPAASHLSNAGAHAGDAFGLAALFGQGSSTTPVVIDAEVVQLRPRQQPEDELETPMRWLEKAVHGLSADERVTAAELFRIGGTKYQAAVGIRHDREQASDRSAANVRQIDSQTPETRTTA